MKLNTFIGIIVGILLLLVAVGLGYPWVMGVAAKKEADKAVADARAMGIALSPKELKAKFSLIDSENGMIELGGKNALNSDIAYSNLNVNMATWRSVGHDKGLLPGETVDTWEDAQKWVDSNREALNRLENSMSKKGYDAILDWSQADNDQNIYNIKALIECFITRAHLKYRNGDKEGCFQDHHKLKQLSVMFASSSGYYTRRMSYICNLHMLMSFQNLMRQFPKDDLLAKRILDDFVPILEYSFENHSVDYLVYVYGMVDSELPKEDFLNAIGVGEEGVFKYINESKQASLFTRQTYKADIIRYFIGIQKIYEEESDEVELYKKLINYKEKIKVEYSLRNSPAANSLALIREDESQFHKRNLFVLQLHCKVFRLKNSRLPDSLSDLPEIDMDFFPIESYAIIDIEGKKSITINGNDNDWYYELE